MDGITLMVLNTVTLCYLVLVFSVSVGFSSLIKASSFTAVELFASLPDEFALYLITGRTCLL